MKNKFNWKMAFVVFFGFIGIILAIGMFGTLFALALVHFHPVMIIIGIVLVAAAIIAYFAGSDPEFFG